MKKFGQSLLLFVSGFVLCYLLLFPRHAGASNTTMKISFAEIWMPKTTAPNGTLGDAGEYDESKGEVVGFSCVPSGDGVACYVATKLN